jgi:PAS domain S-box-containing protein
MARISPILVPGESPHSAVVLVRDITKRKQAEEALRESEARYRAISELISDYTFSARVESDGRVVPQWVAGAFQQITGYSWEEFIALGSWPQIVYPDDWPNDQLDLEALLENRPINRELRIVTKSGEVRWILNSVRPVWNDQQGRVTELIGAVRDISERKQAEEALRESEQKFRGIVEQASDGIVLTDEHGNVVEWNRAQERITQLSARDVIGQPLWDIQFQVATPDRNTAILREQIKASMLECLQSGQAPWLNQLTEQVIQRPDGTHRNVQSLVFPITMRTGFLLGSVIRDITERKRAEQALRESEFQYRTTLARLYPFEMNEEAG